MFDGIEQAGQAGSAQVLKAKALQLNGGPNSLVARREQPGLQVVSVPARRPWRSRCASLAQRGRVSGGKGPFPPLGK